MSSSKALIKSNFPTALGWRMLFKSSFYRRGNRGPERQSQLLSVTQPILGRAEIWTRHPTNPSLSRVYLGTSSGRGHETTQLECRRNGPEVEVAGASEPGEMEGGTGRSQGPGLERGCLGEECGFCSEVHKP